MALWKLVLIGACAYKNSRSAVKRGWLIVFGNKGILSIRVLPEAKTAARWLENWWLLAATDWRPARTQTERTSSQSRVLNEVTNKGFRIPNSAAAATRQTDSFQTEIRSYEIEPHSIISHPSKRSNSNQLIENAQTLFQNQLFCCFVFCLFCVSLFVLKMSIESRWIG